MSRTGAENLGLALRKLGKRYATKLGEEAVESGATLIKMEMMRLAPRRTGKLQSSIEVSKPRRGANRREIEVTVGPTVFYAHMVENGTRSTRKQPFIRPAFHNRKKEAERLIERILAAGS